MKKNDLEKDSVRRLKIDDSADGQRLDNFLMARLKGVPKSRIYKLVRGGEVRINGGRVEVSYRLKLGDEVRIPPVRVAVPVITPATHLPQGGIRLVPHILYRDDALIALNKPAGMAVHGGSGISRGVIEQMRLELPECRYMELVHRLDRETSGVLLIALKRRALTGLHAAMRDGKIEKRYLTLVAGRWPNPVQHVKLPLHKRVTDEGEKRVTVRDEGQTAHTIFRRLQGFIRIHPAGSGTEDRAHPSDSRAYLASRVSDRGGRQIRRFRTQQAADEAGTEADVPARRPVELRASHFRRAHADRSAAACRTGHFPGSLEECPSNLTY